MRKVRRWRYYCEYCKKSGGSAGHMKKHEAGCTLNPNRVCKMCEINEEGSEQRPMAELIAICGEPDGFVYPVPDELRVATNNCPACILAAIRQSGGGFDFDYAKERDAMWARITSEQREYEEQMMSYRPY